MATKTFKPSSQFIPGTNVRTPILRYELIGRRVWVVYEDGLRVRSHLLPSDLKTLLRDGEITEDGQKAD